MRKNLLFLSSIFTLTSMPIIIISSNNNPNQLILAETPVWVHNMIKNNDKEISIGYDHHFLINKNKDKQDTFQQKDWIDLDINQDLYLYLPQANNIDQAIETIAVEDSAKTTTINIETPVTWKKINKNTYTNNTFITQDTSVSGISLIDNIKFNEIKNSNIVNTWTEDEKKFFDNYASFPAGIKDRNKRQNQNWWNANGWEALLSEEKNLISKSSTNPNERFSQLDLYNTWINQQIIGMNVPLSLIEENSFIISTTEINHIFRFQIMPQQTWIDNSGNLRKILTPHWGFTLSIKEQEQKVFQTPQLIHLKNTYKENQIIDYLTTVSYFSFNSQENTKFKNNYIA